MIVNDYPTIHLLLRGDSGFAAPDLYKQCEENGTSYVIRLKGNKVLREKASFLADALTSRTQNNKVDYAVVYGEFMYKAGPWPYERRVVCKVEKPENQMVYMYTFIVTNMDSSPEYLIKFYCKRGLMENFIKESKSGFDFSAVSSHNRIVNANRQCVRPAAKIFTDFTSIDFGTAKSSRRCTAWYGKPAFCTLLYPCFACQPPIRRQVLHSTVKCFTVRTSKDGF